MGHVEDTILDLGAHSSQFTRKNSVIRRLFRVVVYKSSLIMTARPHNVSKSDGKKVRPLNDWVLTVFSLSSDLYLGVAGSASSCARCDGIREVRREASSGSGASSARLMKLKHTNWAGAGTDADSLGFWVLTDGFARRKSGFRHAQSAPNWRGRACRSARRQKMEN